MNADSNLSQLFDICDNDCTDSFDLAGDCYVDNTFPDLPSILDVEDLKVNGLMCFSLSIYQTMYVGLFAALFILNFSIQSSVTYLAPLEKGYSKYCTETPMSITDSYWIDTNGSYQGSVNFDPSHTVYRLEMKNMKISFGEYQQMIDYFENEVKKIGQRASQRDATYSFVAYGESSLLLLLLSRLLY